jgi:type II secretory pathway pseudopilin PulG
MHTITRHPASRRGISLIETVVALIVLSGAMVATLNTVASARASQVMAGQRAQARLLAESMLQEVLAQPYAEAGSTTLGPDAGETGNNRRDGFDDVDDYDGWAGAASSPDSTPLTGYEGYSVRIAVRWVDPDGLTDALNHDAGVKQVVVSIAIGKQPLVELQGWAAAP